MEIIICIWDAIYALRLGMSYRTRNTYWPIWTTVHHCDVHFNVLRFNGQIHQHKFNAIMHNAVCVCVVVLRTPQHQRSGLSVGEITICGLFFRIYSMQMQRLFVRLHQQRQSRCSYRLIVYLQSLPQCGINKLCVFVCWVLKSFTLFSRRTLRQLTFCVYILTYPVWIERYSDAEVACYGYQSVVVVRLLLRHANRSINMPT